MFFISPFIRYSDHNLWMVQGAWPPWMQSITYRRLDLKKVRVIRDWMLCHLQNRQTDDNDEGVFLCAFAVELGQVVRATPLTVYNGASTSTPFTVYNGVSTSTPFTVDNGETTGRR